MAYPSIIDVQYAQQKNPIEGNEDTMVKTYTLVGTSDMMNLDALMPWLEANGMRIYAGTKFIAVNEQKTYMFDGSTFKMM